MSFEEDVKLRKIMNSANFGNRPEARDRAELERQRAELEADESLPAAVRAEKISEIDRLLSLA